jgi:hypothetical protein
MSIRTVGASEEIGAQLWRTTGGKVPKEPQFVLAQLELGFGQLPLNHRQVQRKKLWILSDEMRVVLGDALGEHGNRGVSHSVHNDLLSRH